MAARYGNEDGREDFGYGHLIMYSHIFPNFTGVLPRAYRKYFDILCPVLPTSWALRVSFHRMSDDTVSLMFNIDRRDEYRFEVDVSVWMEMFLCNTIPNPAISFKLSSVPYRDDITRVFNNVVPTTVAVLQQLRNQTLTFKISISVYGCHGEDDLKRHGRKTKAGNHELQALFSKM